MELKERIALARKQAGLSQEQLGEKLGVSRQAVSKWESGQSNPDVAYLAEMCRLFGVSSDWLLLGKETDDASIPARCPDCQAIVTGLDNFCPNCGCSLKASPKVQYALVLKSALTSPEDNLTLYQICEEGVYKPAFSLPNQDLLGYTHKILCQAPRALFRGLTLDQARALQSRFAHPGDLLVCFDPTGNAPLPRLMDRPYKPSPQQGLSFWTTVGAVILGVICALLILMIVF